MAEFEIVEKESHPILYVSRKTASEAQDISAEMASGFHDLMVFVGQNQIDVVGPPLSIYSSFDETETEFDVAFPISKEDAIKIPTGEDIKAGETPGGKVMKSLHKGPYENLAATYQALFARAAAEGLNPGISWEYYLNDPGQTPQEELLTEIHVLLT